MLLFLFFSKEKAVFLSIFSFFFFFLVPCYPMPCHAFSPKLLPNVCVMEIFHHLEWFFPLSFLSYSFLYFFVVACLHHRVLSDHLYFSLFELLNGNEWIGFIFPHYRALEKEKTKKMEKEKIVPETCLQWNDKCTRQNSTITPTFLCLFSLMVIDSFVMRYYLRLYRLIHARMARKKNKA